MLKVISSGNVVMGAATRTRRGRELLTAEYLHRKMGVEGAAADPSAWWVDREAGVALFSPQATAAGRGAHGESALVFRGTLLRVGSDDARAPTAGVIPAAADHVAGLLDDLLERDAVAVGELQGHFALACWDGRRRRLLVARDHLGQQSMYVRADADLYVFSSELAPLLRSPTYSCELNPEAAFWYLAFGRPMPRGTLARGVERVPAAHYFVWEPAGTLMMRRYWTPLSADSPRTGTPEVFDEIQKTLDRAIEAQCASEEPQGVLLSGGTDSTYIAATAAGLNLTNLQAFTASFDEELFDNADVRYATLVAGRLKISHHVVQLTSQDALRVLEEQVLTADEPCAPWVSITHFWLLDAARQTGVRRMLCGLGADEIFGGYEDHHRVYAAYLDYCRRHPAPPDVDEFESLLLNGDDEADAALYAGLSRYFDEYFLRVALTQPYGSWHYGPHLREFYRECRRLKPEAQMIEMMVAHECQHRIPDLLLLALEAVSRRAGVEMSYPCLHPEVVRLATGLDVLSRYRTPGGEWSERLEELEHGFKHSLMQVYRRKVPEEVLKRPINTYTAPFAAWFGSKEFAGPLVSRLSKSRFWERDIVGRHWLDEMLEQISPGPGQHLWAAHKLWALLTLVSWYDRFVEHPG